MTTATLQPAVQPAFWPPLFARAPGSPRARLRLLLVVLLVLLAHGWLLGEWGRFWQSGQSDADIPATEPQAPRQLFSSHLISGPPMVLPRHPSSALPVARPPAPEGELAGKETFAVSAPAPANLTPPPEPSQTPTPNPASAGVAAAAALTKPVAQYPDSVKLEFDGQGKEKGLISYTGSAELVWSRQADKYETRLDISALGFRLITWTSKGSLSNAGLEPVRFGDRRRGPEVATHFQRDKNLITFSTNRPEVPLQAGAQDKLSALLQLTALVSGGPQQYLPGSKIVFQAADAYRAELWEFKVGAPEKMELPGGTKTVVGFVKNPTVEFDQKVEVWLAPDLAYLPVRLRITEPNGTYSDLLWRKTLKAE